MHVYFGSTQNQTWNQLWQFWWRPQKVHALNKLWQPINTKISSKCALPWMKVYDCCVISLDKRPSLRQWLVHCRLIDRLLYWPSPGFTNLQRSQGKEGKLNATSVDQIKLCRMNDSFTQKCRMSATRVYVVQSAPTKMPKSECEEIIKCDSLYVFSEMIVEGQICESELFHRRLSHFSF